MSLPPGFLDELRNRTSLVRVIGRKVSWDQRKSNTARGDYWAPCPFHQEKTASFHVDDQKGFYYCFGCQAKGDALSFVRETENVGFIEAVEILAREAGMTMPAPDPQAAGRETARAGLVEVMEDAVRFYRLQLKTGAAAQVRAYLDGRALSEAMREKFEIGYAPDSRTSLFAHLSAKGIAPALIVEAGLAIAPEDGNQPYDRFRGRIMFPIRDARGRAIAFGGRAMSAQAQAKYLNSPETPLFDKGRSLYNIGPARRAAGQRGADGTLPGLIVAEGYMDVIALAQAGFENAVAPLGTAITPEQLQMLWRIAPEPVIALDGDSAGLRAAERLIDLALPHLASDRSLRFALLPQGQDPDDLIRAGGTVAMRQVLAGARPLVDMLWQRETAGQVFDSPERRRALDKRLRAAVALIPDAGLRDHYVAALRALRAQMFDTGRRSHGAQAGRGGAGRRGARDGRAGGGAVAAIDAAGPTSGARQSALARAPGPTAALLREGAILLVCLNHPDLADRHEADLSRLTFRNPDMRAIARALLASLAEVLQGDPAHWPDLLCSRVTAHTGSDPVARLTALPRLREHPHLHRHSDPAMARQALREEIDRAMATEGMAAEVRDARADMQGVADEGVTFRLHQAALARDKGLRGTIVGTESTGETDAEMLELLQSMIEQRVWERKKR